MHRTGQQSGFQRKLVVYVLAGTASGALAGAAFGSVGSLLPTNTRALLGTGLALGAIVIGIAGVIGYHPKLLQIDRETPYGWLAPGPLRWAVRNGAAIGFGARTRLGFWLWYVIPLGAFISGSPLLGAIGYGLYGFTRTLGAGGILFLERTGRSSGLKILRQSQNVRTVTDVQLIVIALAVLLVVGS